MENGDTLGQEVEAGAVVAVGAEVTVEVGVAAIVQETDEGPDHGRGRDPMIALLQGHPWLQFLLL